MDGPSPIQPAPLSPSLSLSSVSSSSPPSSVSTDEVDEEDPPLVQELTRACRAGNLATARALVDAWRAGAGGAAGLDFALYPAVYAALRHDRVPVARWLLEQAGVPLWPLAIERAVAAHASDAVLELLREHGMAINVAWTAAFPPVMAQAVRDERMVRWFLAHGADPNAACRTGHTPLHAAAGHGLPRVLELMLDAGGDPTWVLPAAVHGRPPTAASLAILSYLIDRGARIDAFDKENCPFGFAADLCPLTALMSAAELGKAAVVDFLLEAGADVRKVDRYGRTAGELAEMRGHMEIAQRL